MFFDELKLENVGPHSNIDLKFSPVGINFIHGYNGYGKTQIVSAIVFALYGGKNIVDYQPDGKLPGIVELTICEGKNSQTLKYIFTKDQDGKSKPQLRFDKQIVFHPDNLEPKKFDKILLHSIRENNSPSFLFELSDDIEPPVLSPREIEIISEFAKDDKKINVFWQNIYNQVTKDPSSAFSFMSMGSRHLFRLTYELVKRYKSETPIPLISDSTFSLFDDTSLRFIYKLLGSISEKNQVLIFSNNEKEISYIPKEHLKTYISLESKHIQQLSSISFNYDLYPPQPIRLKKDQVSRSLFPSPKDKLLRPLVVTEGKTDWKHLKAALEKFHGLGEFLDHDIEFHEYEDNVKMGSAELLNLCKQASKLPQHRKTICIFDRDEPNIISQVQNKNWGNSIYSFAIPIPDHRKETEDICIELFYKDSEIIRTDNHNRRLFLSNEFSSKSGKHKQDKMLNYLYPNRIDTSKTLIIDNNVFDADDNNVALSKNQFAEYVLKKTHNFDDFEFLEFKKIFNILFDIANS